MIPENVTADVKQALYLASREAKDWRHTAINTHHILRAIVSYPLRPGATLLEVGTGTMLALIWAEIADNMPPAGVTTVNGELPLAPRISQMWDWAQEEAAKLGHQEVNTGHLVLAILRETNSPAAEMLQDFKINLAEVRERLAVMMSAAKVGAEPQLLVPDAPAGLERLRAIAGLDLPAELHCSRLVHDCLSAATDSCGLVRVRPLQELLTRAMADPELMKRDLL